MSFISKFATIAILGALMAIPAAAAPRIVGPRIVRVPHVVVNPYVPFAGFGYYKSPGWYYPGYAVVPNTGEVRIDTHLKDASLFVDGGYVGPVNKFKKFSLKPGNHDIALRDGYGSDLFNERVHVIAGKSIEVRPSA